MRWCLVLLAFLSCLCAKELMMTWQGAIDITSPLFPSFMLHTHTTQCKDTVCIQETFSVAKESTLFVIYVVHDMQLDFYSAMHAPFISHLLRSVPMRLHNVFIDCEITSCYDMFTMTMSVLPPRAIFVSMGKHGHVVIPHSAILLAAKQSGRQPPILFHANHEQPWASDDSNSRNFLGPQDDVIAEYSQFPLVLRHYYYKPYSNVSTYVPVGIPNYGLGTLDYMSGECRDEEGTMRPVAQRTRWCSFLGRVEYDNSFAASERQRLISALSSASMTESCPMDTTRISNSRYMRQLCDSVLVPCPGGQNPETFRHYEVRGMCSDDDDVVQVLEAGGIPIFTRPPSDLDYYQFWEDYPGPVLESWDEFPAYLRNFTQEEASRLQKALREWYPRYIEKTRARIADAIMKIYLDSASPEL